MILGDSGVGKNLIINRFVDDIFDDNISSTFGINFSYKEIIINKKHILKKIIDTCDQEKY